MSSSEEELAARLAEDEAAAKAATDGPWYQEGSGIRGRSRAYAGGDPGILVVKHTWPQESAHIVRHDPARVLRYVGAVRAILAEMKTGGGNSWAPDYYEGLNFALIALGEVYDDGPGEAVSTGEDPVAWLRRVITASLTHHRQVAGSDDAGEKGARCEAELAILDEHRSDEDSIDPQCVRCADNHPYMCECGVLDGQHWRTAVSYPCRTVRLLADGYRYRSGYPEAWAVKPGCLPGSAP